MEISRLEKSSNALLTSLHSLRQYCEARGIPHTTNFYNTVLPTHELKQKFAQGYPIPRLPATNLKEKGSSAAIVFERKAYRKDGQSDFIYNVTPENEGGLTESFHGEVVATVCQQVGSALQPGINTLYVTSSLNPNYRVAFEKDLVEPIKELIENQGIPVVVTSMNWNDLHLDFDNGLDEQANHLWRVTAFVVDSAGNNGRYGETGEIVTPTQKHNILTHAAPLVVHVGAASRNKKGNWVIEGYSSANSPTFLAPVAPEASVLWGEDKPPEGVLGTSVAGPYAGGVLTALNRRYGAYLTREQILFAIIATCHPITHVAAFGKKTPAPKDIAYTENGAGLHYNPEYGGFGLIDPIRADHLLGHMVALTQNAPETITIPTEQRVRLDIEDATAFALEENGLYSYKIVMPPGWALKTTLEVDFENEFGKVSVTSPLGTSFPMVLSKSPSQKINFGISTCHGWTGEPLAGTWIISSTTPIKRLRLNQHHFLEDDIIHSLDIKQLDETPWPDISHAKSLRDLGPDYSISRILHSKIIHGLGVNGVSPKTKNITEVLEQLKALPSGFSQRNREIEAHYYHVDRTSPAGNLELQANLATSSSPYDNDAGRLNGARLYQQAAIIYGQTGKNIQYVNTLSLAAQNYLNCRYMLDDRSNLNPEQAISLLQQAITISSAAGHWYAAYRDNEFLYTALCRTCLYYSDKQPEKTAAYASLLESVRTQARHFSFQRQGGEVPTAHRIEEGEMGFSDHEPIGTDNLSPCIAIIAQNPITRKTGLAHLDNLNDLHSLDQFFSQLGEERLNIRLVGARFQDHLPTKQNLLAVMRYLAHVNGDLISVDIYDGNTGASAVIVDPVTFCLEEKVPTYPSPNEGISNTMLLFAPEGKPLITQFDYTSSKDRAPLLLSPSALTLLRSHYIDRPEWMIEKRLGMFCYTDRAVAVNSIMGMLSAYEKEWGQLSDHLEQTITSQKVNEDDAQKARTALLGQGFYVGTNATAYNGVIYDWISHQLFEQGVLQGRALTKCKPFRNSYEPIIYQESVLPTQPRTRPQGIGKLLDREQ